MLLKKKTQRWSLLFSVCVAFAGGCGSGSSDKVETVSVSGVVKVDGAAIEGATVNFFSKESNFLSSGVTDSSGKYQLYQGAAVGENKVWISKNTSPSSQVPEGADIAEFPDLDPGQNITINPNGTADEPAQKGEQIAEKFSSVDKTVLKYTVPEGGTDTANFDLTKQ